MRTKSCCPDLAIAVYPGHMLENTSKDFELNPAVPVTRKTPPTFFCQAEDDDVDDVENSLVYYIALKKAGVPVEMHSYPHGGDSFGLRRPDAPITALAGVGRNMARSDRNDFDSTLVVAYLFVATLFQSINK
jgi:acetyl esterase/lipase